MMPDSVPPYSGTKHHTTIYDRFNRWSRQGIWLAMFKAVRAARDVIGTASIDSSHVKAHRSAGGGKRGAFEEAIGRSRGGRTTMH